MQGRIGCCQFDFRFEIDPFAASFFFKMVHHLFVHFAVRRWR
jgi:hypothetical protein